MWSIAPHVWELRITRNSRRTRGGPTTTTNRRGALSTSDGGNTRSSRALRCRAAAAEGTLWRTTSSPKSGANFSGPISCYELSPVIATARRDRRFSSAKSAATPRSLALSRFGTLAFSWRACLARARDRNVPVDCSQLRFDVRCLALKTQCQATLPTHTAVRITSLPSWCFLARVMLLM